MATLEGTAVLKAAIPMLATIASFGLLAAVIFGWL